MKRDGYGRPGMVTGLYLVACAVFAVIAVVARGIHVPSMSLFVTSLTGAALAWTLDVLVRYGRDTRTIARAAAAQVENAREQRDREDRRALGAIAVLLLEDSIVGTLYPTVNAQDQARWRIRATIANTIVPVEGKAYLPICAEISHFVTDESQEGRVAKAIELAGRARVLANREQMIEYGRLGGAAPS